MFFVHFLTIYDVGYIFNYIVSLIFFLWILIILGTEIYSDVNEVLESADPLLNRFDVDETQESLNTKDNQTPKI